jgi:hypothetical protein
MPRAGCVERDLHGGTDPGGDRHQVRPQRRVEGGPVVDLGARDDECVPGRERRDAEERDHFVVLVHEPPGQVAGNDHGEDGSHAGIIPKAT